MVRNGTLTQDSPSLLLPAAAPPRGLSQLWFSSRNALGIVHRHGHLFIAHADTSPFIYAATTLFSMDEKHRRISCHACGAKVLGGARNVASAAAKGCHWRFAAKAPQPNISAAVTPTTKNHSRT
jgi:hypothetical protein